jgi:single-stranded-DNA-specific exonuclease
VEAFQKKFEEVVSSTITDEMLVPEIEIDAPISLNEITPAFYNVIKQFAPFGPGNMNPVFVTENVSDRGYASIVGSNHLKFDVIQKGIKFPAIGFGLSMHYEYVVRKNPFSVCYNIREQQWKGKTYLQLQGKDLKK